MSKDSGTFSPLKITRFQRKAQLLLVFLCLWDFHIRSTATGAVMGLHRPRGYLYQPTHPLYHSTFYPKFWNLNYGKSPQSRPFIHNASLYFSPFKTPENPTTEQTSVEGGSQRVNKVLTPFIGARALSNMEKFFEDLQENLQILKGNYDGRNSGSDPKTTEDLTISSPVMRLPKEKTEAPMGSNNVIKSLRGRQRWVNPAASFFRGKHRLFPRGYSSDEFQMK